MQTRGAQVRVDQKSPLVGLANDGANDIGGDKGFTFALRAAGDQEAAKFTRAGNLIETRTKSAEALPNDAAAFAGERSAQSRVGFPFRMRAARDQVFVAKRRAVVIETLIMAWPNDVFSDAVRRNGLLEAG